MQQHQKEELNKLFTHTIFYIIDAFDRSHINVPAILKDTCLPLVSFVTSARCPLTHKQNVTDFDSSPLHY